jgi:hypothetical protein
MKRLIKRFVNNLRKRIIFSKSEWDFNYYFQKINLVLLYCLAEDLMVDNFPPPEFFVHSKYNPPDQVEMVLRKSENEHFLKRFVPREFWAEDLEESDIQVFNNELENIAYDNRRDPSGEHIFREGNSIQQDDFGREADHLSGHGRFETLGESEEDKKTHKVNLSWLTGARHEEHTEKRSTKKKQKNSSAKRKRRQNPGNEVQCAPWLIKEKGKYPFSGGLSNLMRAPEPKPASVFVSEEEEQEAQSENMRIEEEVDQKDVFAVSQINQNPLKQLDGGELANNVKREVPLPRTPEKSNAKIAYISTGPKLPDPSPRTSQKKQSPDQMKIFLEDNNSKDSNLLDFSNKKREKHQSTNFGDIHLEISEESGNENGFKEGLELKDLPEEDNSTKTFQDFNQNQLASPANSSSPTDPSCDSLSEFTTKLKEGTLSVLSKCKDTWVQRFGMKGGVMSKEDRQDGAKIFEDGVERLEELCQKVDWIKMSRQQV